MTFVQILKVIKSMQLPLSRKTNFWNSFTENNYILKKKRFQKEIIYII